MAACLTAASSRPHKAVISDVHRELVDFYRAVKDGHSNDIYDFMKTHPNTEDTYYHIRNDMPVQTSLDNAKSFYYLRKTCYRGMMRYNRDGGFNIPFGRYKKITCDDLTDPKYTELLKRTDVCCCDFSTIFDTFNHKNYFMFLDPPYDSTFTNYGYCEFGEKEHRRLAECVRNTKTKCLMVIGKTPLIEELYGELIIEEYPKKYRFKLHSGRINDNINTTHVIIKNY
jgi:DNA adenine methylase